MTSALEPEVVVAVECLRAAVKVHARAMLALSKATTPAQREACQRDVQKAAATLDLAHVELDDVLAGPL